MPNSIDCIQATNSCLKINVSNTRSFVIKAIWLFQDMWQTTSSHLEEHGWCHIWLDTNHWTIIFLKEWKKHEKNNCWSNMELFNDYDDEWKIKFYLIHNSYHWIITIKNKAKDPKKKKKKTIWFCIIYMRFH